MAQRGSRGDRTFKAPDGKIRQSQLITTFGPGSMVDLINRAVVIGGLEHWGYRKNDFVALDDERLRAALLPRLRSLDANLDLAREDYFRMAPECDSKEAKTWLGVRALEFPRWFVCQGCRRLARVRDAFEEKNGRYRHTCDHGKPIAVPVRFVAACKAGHLSDFPWRGFAHPDGVCDRPELYLYEGATGDASGIRVHCKNCDSSRTLGEVSGARFTCRGERPWLGGDAANADCSKPMELLVRTATNAYFSQVVSALRLPEPQPDPLRLRLREKIVWNALKNVSSLEQLQMLVGIQDFVQAAVQDASLEAVLAAIEQERAAGETPIERPLRTAEYERFLEAPEESRGQLTPQGAQFAAYRIPAARADLPVGISRLVIVPELREVRVQVSFSRFDSVSANLQGEYEYGEQNVTPATLTLSTSNEKWLPAAEVRGEGVFFELDPDHLRSWEQRPEVQERAETLLRAFELESPGTEFLGIRFYLLHSLSHLLMTAISLECGYAASAIRERIYCQPSHDDLDMAGILISTGTTGSEGTLGGLVEEGRNLRHHLREAWELGRLCSNDPVCAAHDPASDHSTRRLEGAACHGCLFIAENSCERFNRYLDRALVVPTIGNDPALAYFATRP